MERKDREGSLGRPKQEPLPSLCSYSSFAKDKENSEPMDIGSPPSAGRAEDLSEEANTEPSTAHHCPPPLLPNKPSSGTGSLTSSGTPAATTQSTAQPKVGGSSRSSMIHLSNGATPDAGRSAIGTPQSLSQIINNLPGSNFSFDLGELQSPVGSGFISPGSTKLGKKRPLSISPLSSSSINIDALVRGSPTSLLNFITNQSRNSSAGSFGHLSPSLYATSSNNHSSFNRPAISLSKAVHPPLFPMSTSHSVGAALPSGFAGTAVSGSKTPNSISSDSKMTMKSELADIADHDASIQPIMKASLEQESEGELSLPPVEPHNSIYSESASENESKSFQKHGNQRIYYSYPAVEEPHNNCCMWEGCQQQFDSLDHLVMHVNSDHIYQESRKEFVCCWTGCVRERRPFKAQYMLLVHMRRHTGEKPHRCHYQGCEKAYSRLENLKTHLRSHTGEKPYLCKYEGCGKAFSNASDCAKHMNRTHSDEKPYGCLNPGCMKRYTDPSSRRKHMKNCQVNKKARTGGDSTSGPEGDDITMDTRPLPISSTEQPSVAGGGGGNKKTTTTTKTKRSEKKRKEENWSNKTHQPQHALVDQFPSSQNNMDLGYMSGESQCTPGTLMAALTKGRTQLSGYNSSGYDTEYPSLPEDHNIPPLIMTPGNETDTFYDNCIVKREQFSPSSQMEHYPYQLSQPPPPPPYSHYKHGLQPLPEVYHHQYHPSQQQHQYSSYHNGGGGLEGSLSSDYSSFGGSPMINNNDDTSSMMSNSFNGSGQRSIKGSDLSNGSHSSFSTLSSRLSSPTSSTTNRSIVGRGDYSKHSYRNLRPPDLILRPQQPSYSVQMSDIKGGPPNCYRRQSDELSLRSSHSSRFSGSEYSDDITRALGPPPPLPHPDTHSSSRGDPLPLPQSMQPDYVMSDMVAMTTDPRSIQYMSKEMSPIRGGHTPSSSSSSGGYHVYTTSTNGGGMVPLKHYEPLHKQPPLPMIFESQVQSDSANMVIGSMSINASQLQQDNLLLESLSTSHPYI